MSRAIHRALRFEVTREQRQLARDRTAFLADHWGIRSMTLQDLLANAYVQGLIDAAETVGDRLMPVAARTEGGSASPQTSGPANDTNPLLAALTEENGRLREALSDKQVGEAMLDAWNDICGDTGCFPLDIAKINKGGPLTLAFQPRHWADQIAARLRALTVEKEGGSAREPSLVASGSDLSEPGKDGGWQPIESAPKDGTRVDLWDDGRRLTGYFWNTIHKAWARKEWKRGLGEAHLVERVSPNLKPSHWMPIPAPPSEHSDARSQDGQGPVRAQTPDDKPGSADHA